MWKGFAAESQLIDSIFSVISPHCHPLTPIIKFRVSHSFFCYAAKTDFRVSDWVKNWNRCAKVAFWNKNYPPRKWEVFFQEFRDVKCIKFNAYHKSYLPKMIWKERYLKLCTYLRLKNIFWIYTKDIFLMLIIILFPLIWMQFTMVITFQEEPTEIVLWCQIVIWKQFW